MNFLGRRESELSSLLEIERKLTDLEIDLESKRIYLEGLEAKLTSVDLEAGLDQLNEGKVYTNASPPLYPISPNKKLILALCMTGFLVLGIIISLLRQATRQTIFNLTQLAELRQLSNKFCIRLKYNKNKFFFLKESLRNSPFNLQFHSSLKKVSGKGCIVDISQENKEDGIRADTFTLKIAEIIANSTKINVYVNHLFHSSINKTLGMVGEQSVIEKEKNTYRNLVINRFEKKKDKDPICFPSDVSLQKNDHCLLSLGESITDLDKYNVISQCDYYILIAQSGKVDLKTVQKFAERVEGDTNKCLAFFLII